MMKGVERRGTGGGETILTTQKRVDAKGYSQTPNPVTQPPSKRITLKPARLLCFYSEDESARILLRNQAVKSASH